MRIEEILNIENPVFRGYITWSGVVILKMLLMALLTSIQRYKNGAVENEEDVREGIEIKKDEKVERVRRAHLNDLENIPAFLIAALFYVLSEPNVSIALWLFRVAVISRIFHTIVYAVYPIRQPARGICFAICLLITLFMLIWSMVTFFEI